MKISKRAYEILNDNSRIEKRNRWMTKLQDYPNLNNTEKVFAVNGIVGQASDAFLLYNDPEKWVVECLENLAERIHFTDNETMFVPACFEAPIFGVHFIDRIFGADVFFQDDQWYNNYLKTPVGSLQYPKLDIDETWGIAKRIANAFLEQDVRLPLFGLPTIASALNIAVNLYGQNILLEMLLNPDIARNDLETINKLLCDLHLWYINKIPYEQLQPVISWNRTQPPGYGQLCGCTCQLISSETYNDLILPLDNELLSVYPNGGMIHLCGSHTQHIHSFKSMPSLKSIQLNDRAALDLEQYYLGLRDDQLIYLNPCEDMSIEKALEITNGKRLVIADNVFSSSVEQLKTGY